MSEQLTRQVQFRLSESDYTAMQRIAKSQNRSVANMVTHLCRIAIEQATETPSRAQGEFAYSTRQENLKK